MAWSKAWTAAMIWCGRPRPAPWTGPRTRWMCAQKAAVDRAGGWPRVKMMAADTTRASATAIDAIRTRARWRASASLGVSSGSSARATGPPVGRPRRRRRSMTERDPRRRPSARDRLGQAAASAAVRSSPTACSRPAGSANSAEPATSTLAPARTAPATVAVEMPPSTSMSTSAPCRLDQAAQLGHLGLHGGEVALAAEAGVHGHDQHHVDQVEHVGHVRDRRGRVEGHRRGGAQLGDGAQHPVQVQAGLGVHDQALAAGLDVQVGQPVRLLDHQVGLERHAEQRAAPRR